MQAEVSFGKGDELQAPAVYTILAHPEHVASLKTNTALIDDLCGALKHAASESGVSLLGEPILHVAPQDGLAEHEFRVRSAGVGESLSRTQTLRKLEQDGEHQIPSGAFLIVAGAQVFQLKLPIINIGRKSDNHLVIENPQVSRRHAQLRAISGSYHFFDLGSTGGSTLNGKETKTAVLMPGDVINLAGAMPLIYGQDSAQNPAETQELHIGQNGHQPA
jgi:hypothetical protein